MVQQFARSQLTSVPYKVDRGQASVNAFFGKPATNPREDGRVHIVHSAPGKYGKPRNATGVSSYLATAPQVLTSKPVNSFLRSAAAFASSREAHIAPVGPSASHIDFLKQGYTERQPLKPIRY
eukprot:scaffold11029_cov135-Isochrysis_galbana.AAC.7